MQKSKILWADDEIDLLKPHILFLESKGYEVVSVNSGADALDRIEEDNFDVVFLDENMPGMSGLEVLTILKEKLPNVPIVMITKNEEERIMEEAIGAKIADYLIKPLNPNQILLSVKKLLDNQRLVNEKTNANYQQEFSRLSMLVSDASNYLDYIVIFKKLIYWELQLDQTENKEMMEVLNMQKKEANHQFCKYIRQHYEDWLNVSKSDAPLLSNQVLRKEVFPILKKEQVVLIVIDNLRYDQWEIIEPDINKLFDIHDKKQYFSILPTATAYARNALFSGKMPLEIEKQYPHYWSGEDEDRPKNNFEQELLGINLKSEGFNDKFSYQKIIQATDGKHISESIENLLQNRFVALVYNFVDMLSHARTDMQMIRELAPDESGYRALTRTWFTHSYLYETLKKLSARKIKVIITTDHGTIRVKQPEKIIGDRDVNTNLRYKQGKNLAFDERSVFFTRKPENFKLPRYNISTSYVFAMEDTFFAYPNNFNQHVNHFKDTFQHGGVSMEEIIVPFIVLSSK